jgi:D-glycero-alpha-D-manno-heptose-7-phosphate kinase
MTPRAVTARAPTRIDLGGGWTDVPPYCEREGGFVCNIAIDRYASARLTEIRHPSHASTGNVSSVSMSDESQVSSDVPLIRAALKRSRVDDAAVAIENDFPFGAGLGGSSAASAAVLGALSEWRDRAWDRADIAEEGRRIEVEELGVAGGRQDHYAATHGGALGLTFTDRVNVRRLSLSEETRRELLARSTLIYTGQSRISGDTITAVLGAYEAGERRVLRALSSMRELARSMANALEHSDLDALGELLREHWEHQRSLHPSIPTERIDEIIDRSYRAGAQGAKAMGASGGGCVLIVARPNNVEGVRHSLRSLGEILDFGLDEAGLTVVADGRTP